MEEKQVNIEINVPAIALTACIQAPGSITIRELTEILVRNLRLDKRYRVLEIKVDGVRSVLRGDEVLDQLVCYKNPRFYLKSEAEG